MSELTEYEYQLSDVDYGEAELQAVVEVLRSKWLSTGKVTQRFEKTLGEYVGARAVAVSSGTAALHLALAALGIKPGDEVVVPSYTFIASVNCIRYQGATPVFIDINGAHDLNLDARQLPQLLTKRTRAILLVHIAGYASNLEEIGQFARQHGLAIVEDAAHAIGSRYGDTLLGTYGDVGCYSFFANKNLATGEGGMLVTHNDSIYEQARSLRSHGFVETSWKKSRGALPDNDVTVLGYNYRTTEIQAALGLAQLAKLERNNSRRSLLVSLYRQRLSKRAGITIPFLTNPTSSSNHIFPIVLAPEIDRDAVIAGLKARGVQTAVHYPPAHLFSLYANLETSLPRTEDVSRRQITLPLHPLLKEADIDRICSLFEEALAGGRHLPRK